MQTWENQTIPDFIMLYQEVLNKTSDINVQDELGNTALLLLVINLTKVAEWGLTPLIVHLLKRGADIGINNVEGVLFYRLFQRLPCIAT